jgi:NAD(P)-dependent dehydrogenase (short-subunit alcohol dehydrogenase family)
VLCRGLADRGYQVVVLDAAADADQVAREAGGVARPCITTFL